MRKIPSRFTVRVNKTNIRRGKKGDSDTCAISKAVAREIMAKRRGASVTVCGGNDIQVTDKSGTVYSYICYTPRVAERIDNFINNFDDKKSKVKPTKFRVKRIHTQIW